ncbi:MAG TPA: diacylglycerol kinase family protein [Puia sp.]|nr:diacylglycerol kinase family protein [Puia sp.]
MARKIIYLINPISGTRGKSSLQEMIIRRTRKENIDFNILPTNAEGEYDFLLPFIEKQKVTDIVICGGDGTVNAVAAALMGTDVRIGIIPMGSGNGLAFAARIPKSPARALDIIFAGRAAAIDGFTINDEFSCMLCGIGFDARVAHEFARQKRRGLQTYVRVSLKHFFKVLPYSFRIHIPGMQGQADATSHSFSAEAFFISIANGNQFGNNFTIAPKASLHDGLIDIVIVKKMNKLRLVFSVLNQIMGHNAVLKIPELEAESRGRKNILYFQTPCLTIENPQRAPLHIDGDPSATSEKFVIRIVPLAFMLIQP